MDNARNMVFAAIETEWGCRAVLNRGPSFLFFKLATTGIPIMGDMPLSTMHTAQQVIQWYSDTAIQWYSDTVIQWYSGTVIQRYSGTVIQWYSGTVIQRYSGTVIQWYSGTVIQWYSDTVVQCYNCSVVNLPLYVPLATPDELQFFWNLAIHFRFSKGVTNGCRLKCLWTQLDRHTTNQQQQQQHEWQPGTTKGCLQKLWVQSSFLFFVRIYHPVCLALSWYWNQQTLLQLRQPSLSLSLKCLHGVHARHHTYPA